MRRNLSIKIFLGLCLTGFLMTSPNAFAENDSGADNNENINNDVSENSIVDDLCERLANENGDPKLGSRRFKEVHLSATNKKVYVPLWFNEESPKDSPDPFRPKIEKEIVLPPPRTGSDGPKPPKPPVTPPKKVIPPLKLFVKGIVGNEALRYAVVVFENEERTVVKDQIVEGKFKVVDVYPDRLVVYSNAEQRRYTFKIGEGEHVK